MQTPHNFLDHLIGEWDLTGVMGDTRLAQAVEAKWVIGGMFVEMNFKATLPLPNGHVYEAIYLIGYNA